MKPLFFGERMKWFHHEYHMRFPLSPVSYNRSQLHIFLRMYYGLSGLFYCNTFETRTSLKIICPHHCL